jgi:sigma-B regulation protein RsbU (phosphoserine phosphatase)
MDYAPDEERSLLFVDDEENILSALKRELRAWAKENRLHLEFATSAHQALEILTDRPKEFAVVVSDLRMPVMKGSDFLIAVRERWPAIVTILLTGFSEIEEVLKAIKAGIFSYLLKPWDSQYLTAELEKALEAFRIERDNERMQRLLQEELRWAGEMQKALLRPAPMKSEGVEFRFTWRPLPGLFCGGNYYDVIALGTGRFLILVGEVAGRGVRGALVTAILKAVVYPEYVRAVMGKRFSPALFLGWMNERINFELKKTTDLTIAFFAAVIDRNEMTLAYANAGLNLPYLIRKGRPNELPGAGPALGETPSAAYKENILKLVPGDIVAAFTGGLVNGLGDEASAAMREILLTIEYEGDYHKGILAAAASRSKSSAFTDDVTLVTARMA